MRRFRYWAIGGLAAVLNCATWAAQPAVPDVRIAVAANFKQTLDQLGEAYGARRARLIVSSGATGMLYSQIVQGAPFDLFFSADVERAEKLEAQRLIAPGSRFTYARGRLVFWRPGTQQAATLDEALRDARLKTLAIANPQLAPYGLAAREVLEKHRLWSQPPFKIVLGESLGQTFQFVASGNADAGFIALSQVYEWQAQGGRDIRDEIIPIDSSQHAPIEQQAVLLADARQKEAARAFLEFVRSETGRRIIAGAGYELESH
jgi:molybdate transport system substrate-binding protein